MAKRVLDRSSLAFFDYEETGNIQSCVSAGMGSMSIQQRFRLFFGVVLAAMVAGSLAVIWAMSSVDRLSRFEQNRYDSYRLADELRQSSDDLTRMARSFAATRDGRFKVYFQDVLDIRAGEIPFPEGYEGIFWDFVVADNGRLQHAGSATSLTERMRRMGFSEAEFAKLSEAESNSNDLANLENVAMNAVIGQFRDDRGGFTVLRTPDQRLALSLLFGDEYHQAKAKIMKPIQEFFELLQARTSAQTRSARNEHRQSILMALIAILVSTALTGWAFYSLRGSVIHPMMDLRNGIEEFRLSRSAIELPVAKRLDEIGMIAAGFEEASREVATYVSEINTARDELIASQADLVEREERIRSLLELSPIGFGLSRLDGGVLLRNDAFRAILGYESDEEIPSDARDIYVDQEDRNRFLDDLNRDGLVSGFETRFRRRDGGTVWVVLSSKIIEYHGEPAVMTWADDITRRKQAEARIAAQKDIIDTAMENMDQGISMFDADLTLAACNQRFRDIFNLPAEICQPGASLEDMFRFNAGRGEYGDGDIEALVRERVELARKFEPHHFERDLTDGRTIEIKGQPVMTGGFVTTYTEITERKQAENDLRDAYHVISSSIDYASRIQRSVLPDESILSAVTADHFLWWEPRDVVGGDLYWVGAWGDGCMILLARIFHESPWFDGISYVQGFR